MRKKVILTLSNVSICSADNCPLGRSCEHGIGVGEGVGRPDVSGDFSLSMSPIQKRGHETKYNVPLSFINITSDFLRSK